MKPWRKVFSIILFFLAAFCVSHGIPVTADASYSTSCAAQANDDLRDDCVALEALYDATGGGQWTSTKSLNWKTTKPLGQWGGVSVSSGRVTSLELNSAKLSGTLPDLSALTQLKILYLNHNSKLSGTIPNLSALTKLETLRMHASGLNGTIPDLSKLTELKELDLRWNRELSGTIPDLSKLTKLEKFQIVRTKIGGEIPDLSKLAKLTTLALSDNKLSGEIPDLSKLTELTTLFLNWNREISGEIPALSTLTKLSQLSLSRNKLSGTIPDLNTLTELFVFNLSENKLSGTIPSLTGLGKLSTLNLSWNELTGAIPSLTGLEKLSVLNLSWNKLSGTIPGLDDQGELSNLSLNDNRISGSIPSSLSDLEKLTFMYLQNNNLDGTLPDLEKLTKAHSIFLQNNMISGEIPDLSKLTGLQYFKAYNNRLSGTLPDLSNLTVLARLELYNNRISGTLDGDDLPDEYPGYGGQLEYVYLHDNLLGSGSDLSPDLGNFSRLKELSLWGNTDPVGTIDFADGVNMSVVDRAALRFFYYANGGSGWTKRSNWLDNWLPLKRWYGVTADSSGRVTGLNLAGNGLKNNVSNSLEALSALTSLNFFHNQQLGGTLAVRLKDIPNLRSVDIRCTGVSTPYSISFNAWVESLGDGFKSGCGATPSQELKEEQEPEPEVIEEPESEPEVLEEPESGPEVVEAPESVSGVYSDWDCGGCAIVPAAETAASRGNTAFNLLLVMIALFAVSRRGRFRSD